MIQKTYQIFVRAASWLQHPFLLIFRLYWGWQFFQTGKGKLAHIADVTGFFQTLHIPFPLANAYLVGSVECFGGLFLLLGLASRLVSAPLAINMIVAYLTAHSDSVKNIFTDPGEFLKQDPFLFLVTALLVLCFGPGLFSIDTLIKKFRHSDNA